MQLQSVFLFTKKLIVMLTKTFTLLFYLKKRSNNVKAKLPTYMRLTVDGRRMGIATMGAYSMRKMA